MSTRIDPLARRPEPADRVHYATGVLLDAEDFEAEQLYHRSRLALALSWLHGFGTVAGLRVEWQRSTEGVEQVFVRAGLAVDRVGRLLEISRDRCLRLDRWYEAQDAADLDAALNVGVGGVVVDVFARFVECPRGKTPAIASGPFDATDAFQPARYRDSPEVQLFVRREMPPPVPAPQWDDLSAVPEVDRLERLQDMILDEWTDRSGDWTRSGLAPMAEHVANQDATSVFLARLVLPATRGAAGERPVREAGVDVQVDNRLRRFVYPVGALARWMEL